MSYYLKWNKDASNATYTNLRLAAYKVREFISDMAEFYRNSKSMIEYEQAQNPDIDYSKMLDLIEKIDNCIGKPERYEENEKWINYTDKAGSLRTYVYQKLADVIGTVSNIEMAIEAFERDNLSLKPFMESGAKKSEDFNVTDIAYKYENGVQRMYYTENNKTVYFSDAINASFTGESFSVLQTVDQYKGKQASDVNASVEGDVTSV